MPPYVIYVITEDQIGLMVEVATETIERATAEQLHSRTLTCASPGYSCRNGSSKGACADLPGEVAEHLGRVLRLGRGADLMLFDGEGGEWQATIEVLERGRVGVRVPGSCRS
jgi:hypothetical protein